MSIKVKRVNRDRVIQTHEVKSGAREGAGLEGLLAVWGAVVGASVGASVGALGADGSSVGSAIGEGLGPWGTF